MNTKYEKELNRICLHIHVPEIYEEDYQMPMLRANKIPGILEVNGCGIDGESRYTYEITGLVSMAVLFETSRFKKGILSSLSIVFWRVFRSCKSICCIRLSVVRTGICFLQKTEIFLLLSAWRETGAL